MPLLTPSCVTLINRSYGENIEGCRPVDIELGIAQGSLNDQDLYAEVSFEVFRSSRLLKVECEEVIGKDATFLLAWEAALRKIRLHRRVAAAEKPLDGTLPYRYIGAVCRRYEKFISQYECHDVVINPQLMGCGMLGMCEADISIDYRLIEVKTVSRSFSSRDIRQLIIYLALDSISGANRWSQAVLFNPRAARYVALEPRPIIEYVSAGRSSIDVYRSIESLLLSREFEVDSKF